MTNIVCSVQEGIKVSCEVIEKLERTIEIITGEKKREEVTAEARRDCLTRDLDQLNGNLMLINEMVGFVQDQIHGQTVRAEDFGTPERFR